VPMRIYPAVHYTMGGLWVDYDLQSTIPGLFVIGEANFSDHGANRLGASALMQGLADGYFILPSTITDYLAAGPFESVGEAHPAVRHATEAVRDRIHTLLSINGRRTVDSFHRELGNILWTHCGMERTKQGLTTAIQLVRALKAEFWRDVKVTGCGEELNQTLERAGRVADFFELGELMCIDPCTGRSRVGATSEPKARPRTAKRCATMPGSPTSPPGRSPATATLRCCTGSTWHMTTSR